MSLCKLPAIYHRPSPYFEEIIFGVRFCVPSLTLTGTLASRFWRKAHRRSAVPALAEKEGKLATRKEPTKDGLTIIRDTDIVATSVSIEGNDHMLDEFLSRHRVFSHAQIGEVLQRERVRSQAAVDARVRRLCLQGRIGRIRRELYYAVPPGETADSCFVDLGLAASLMASDTVLSHVTALEYHTATSIPSGDQVSFLTRSKVRPTKYEGIRFSPCRPPVSLSRTGWQDLQVETVDWLGERVRVTGPERSLVDALNGLKHGGGLKVLWPLLEKMARTEGFSMDRCVEYLKQLENPAAAARAGWFLKRHEGLLKASPWDYALFYEQRPAQPRYLIPGQRGGRLIAEWNLIVPREIMG